MKTTSEDEISLETNDVLLVLRYYCVGGRHCAANHGKKSKESADVAPERSKIHGLQCKTENSTYTLCKESKFARPRTYDEACTYL